MILLINRCKGHYNEKNTQSLFVGNYGSLLPIKYYML